MHRSLAEALTTVTDSWLTYRWNLVKPVGLFMCFDGRDLYSSYMNSETPYSIIDMWEESI